MARKVNLYMIKQLFFRIGFVGARRAQKAFGEVQERSGKPRDAEGGSGKSRGAKGGQPAGRDRTNGQKSKSLHNKMIVFPY